MSLADTNVNLKIRRILQSHWFKITSTRKYDESCNLIGYKKRQPQNTTNSAFSFVENNVILEISTIMQFHWFKITSSPKYDEFCNLIGSK